MLILFISHSFSAHSLPIQSVHLSCLCVIACWCRGRGRLRYTLPLVNHRQQQHTGSCYCEPSFYGGKRELVYCVISRSSKRGENRVDVTVDDVCWLFILVLFSSFYRADLLLMSVCSCCCGLQSLIELWRGSTHSALL